MEGHCCDCVRACGSLSALAMCCLLIHVCHRRSQLESSHKDFSYLSDCRIVHSSDRCTHAQWPECVHTEHSWHPPPVSQSCPYMVRVIDTPHISLQAFFQTFPASLLSALTGDTKQRPGSSRSSPPAVFSLSLQLQLAHTKLSTCLVRISSLEAL